MTCLVFFTFDSALFACGHAEGARELGEGDGAAAAGLEGEMHA